MRLIVLALCLFATSWAQAAEPATKASLYEATSRVFSQPDVPYDVLGRKDVEPDLKAAGRKLPVFSGGCYLRQLRISVEHPLDSLLLVQSINGKKWAEKEATHLFGSLEVGDSLDLVTMEYSHADGKWIKGAKVLTIGSRKDSLKKYITRKKDPVDGWERMTCDLSAPPFELYGHKQNGKHLLMLRATYRGDDWVFAESVKVSLAGRTIALTPGPNSEPHQEITRTGGVEEILHFDVSENLEFLDALFHSSGTKDAKFILRFQGDDKFADRDVAESVPAARTVARFYVAEQFQPAAKLEFAE